MMLRVWIVLLAALAMVAHASSIALPDIPPRMGVDSHVVEAATDAFIRVLRRDVRAEVIPVPYVTPGLAGSLDGDMARLIAELGDAEYGLTGEISRDPEGYQLTVLLTHRATRTVSDVFTAFFQPASAYEDLTDLAASLRDFLAIPATQPADGGAGLFVSSEPGSAEVRIDSRVVGTTGNLDIQMLEPGRYTVEVRKEGFLSEVRRVELLDGEIELLRVVLTPLTGGSAFIDSVPSASVYFEGALLGTTPLSIPLVAGTHNFSLERLGFRSETVPVLVRDYRVSRVVSELEPLTDLVVIWDAQPGTVVHIDDQTYVSFAFDVVPGLRRVVIEQPGRARIERLVAFPSRGVIQIDPDTGKLTILQ